MVKHRGRHQAQGHDIPGGDCSRNWAQTDPYPAVVGHNDLEGLEGELAGAAKAARAPCFRLAHRFIDNASKYGGVGPSRHFPAGRPNEKTDVRVDIEVNRGLAFV